MFLVKTKAGHFIPAYDSDWEEAKKIQPGTEVKATRARNILFHKKGFALMKLAFENQDKYDNFNIFRQIITMKAGFVIWAEDKNGKKQPFAESLSFDSMSQAKFEEWYSAVLKVISKEIGLTSEEISAELLSFM